MTILCNDYECVFHREGICTYELYMRAFHGGAFSIDEDGKCLRRTHKDKEKRVENDKNTIQEPPETAAEEAEAGVQKDPERTEVQSVGV